MLFYNSHYKIRSLGVCARLRGFLAGAASIRVIWLAGPGSVQTDVMPDDGMLNGGKHDDANENRRYRQEQ